MKKSQVAWGSDFSFPYITVNWITVSVELLELKTQTSFFHKTICLCLLLTDLQLQKELMGLRLGATDRLWMCKSIEVLTSCWFGSQSYHLCAIMKDFLGCNTVNPCVINTHVRPDFRQVVDL